MVRMNFRSVAPLVLLSVFALQSFSEAQSTAPKEKSSEAAKPAAAASLTRPTEALRKVLAESLRLRPPSPRRRSLKPSPIPDLLGVNLLHGRPVGHRIVYASKNRLFLISWRSMTCPVDPFCFDIRSKLHVEIPAMEGPENCAKITRRSPILENAPPAASWTFVLRSTSRNIPKSAWSSNAPLNQHHPVDRQKPPPSPVNVHTSKTQRHSGKCTTLSSTHKT